MTLSRSLLAYLPVQAAAALAAFGGVVVYTRLLGAEAYGRYALVLAAVMLLHTLTLTWVEAAAYRFRVRAVAKGWAARQTATVVRTWAITTTVVIGLSVLGLWLAPLPDAIKTAGGWGLAMTVFVSALGVRGEMLRAEQRPGRYSILFAARVGGGFLLGAWLTAVTGLGAAGPLAGVALAAFIVLTLEAPAMLATARGARPRASLARIQAAYALPLAAVLALDLVLSAGDRFVIAGFLGDAAVGAYAAGYGVADRLIMLLFAWAGMAASPLAARAFDTAGADAARAVAGDFARVLVLITFPAAAGIALVAEPLADVLIAHDLDAAAATIMPWIAAGALLNGFVVYYFAYAFQLTRKTGAQAAATGAAALANVALNLVLVPTFGLIGAAWATLAAYALALALFAIVGRRWIALPLPFADVAKTGLACAVMAFVVAQIPAWSETAELAAKAAVGALVYAAMILVLDAGGARGWVRKLWARAHPNAAAPRIES